MQSDDRRGGTARRIRLGVGTKLQIAFGTVALMTAIAAGVAIISFWGTKAGFEQVARHHVPVMTDALRLSAISGETSAAAARFVTTRTLEERAPVAATIALKRRQLEDLIEQLRGSGLSSSAFAQIENFSARLKNNLAELELAISERSQNAASLEKLLAQLPQAHAALSEKLAPIVDDSYFDAVMTAEREAAVKGSSNLMTGVVSNQIDELRRALDISAHAHLVTSLMSEAASAKDPAGLVPIQDRFRAACDLLRRSAAVLGNRDIAKGVADLVTLGERPDGLFALYARQFGASMRADAAVERNVTIQRELDQAVSALVSETEMAMKNGASELRANLLPRALACSTYGAVSCGGSSRSVRPCSASPPVR
jgi:two-component system sensor histidine kinase TorS